MLDGWSNERTNQRMFGVQTLGIFKTKMLSYNFMSYTLIKRFHAIYFTILLKCWLHLSSQTCSSSFANSELYVGCGRVCAIHPCCCYCRLFGIQNVCCASCMRWPLHCIDSWSYINLIHYWIGSQSFRVIILMWFFFRMFVGLLSSMLKHDNNKLH